MKLTIIKPDSYVYVDGVGYKVDNFFEFPAGVKTLQWDSEKGWLEFEVIENQTLPNQDITQLPNWTTNFIVQWQEKNDLELLKQQQHEELTAQIKIEQEQAQMDKEQYEKEQLQIKLLMEQQNANN